MTAGDWIWAVLKLRHWAPYGLLHGALLVSWIGVYLGATVGATRRGAARGALVGLLAAGSFYALWPIFGYSARFVSWIGLWFGVAWLATAVAGTSLWAGGGLLRASVAAAASGAAFYGVSGIWMGSSPTPDYAWHFAAWTLAFAPGFLALFANTR